ncbi:MAG: helix-turn-helix domain-containing protein [Acidimicrobiales bacterium]
MLNDVSQVRIEFTVEPFTEGMLGRHVAAALEALRESGFDPDVGPFGSTVTGEAVRLFPAMSKAAAAAFNAGATGLAMSARTVTTSRDDIEEFLAAVRPVAIALGAAMVEPENLGPRDVPLTWQGEVVAGLHSPKTTDLREGLGRLVRQVEAELGGQLADLPRTEKQRAVRLLDERGAFAFRNAVDEVTDAMGVSRVTVYNYLNATRSSPKHDPSSAGSSPAS